MNITTTLLIGVLLCLALLGVWLVFAQSTKAAPQTKEPPEETPDEDAEVLLRETSPNGNIEAVVEQDDRVVYFYLAGAPETDFGLKACWVRNLAPAPDDFDGDAMKRGDAPMLPEPFCRHPDGAPAFREDSDLRVVWFEEGDAAALLDGSTILSIIPGWSSMEGFHGFARDCIGESSLCTELDTEANVLVDRIRRADRFWRSWDEDPSPWPTIQKDLLEAIGRQLGKEKNYYAIDGKNWPPKALLRIDLEDRIVLVTLGVSIRPMPKVEMSHEDPKPYRRIELAMALSKETPEATIEAAMNYLSGQTKLPWSQYTWLGENHTVPCDAFRSSKTMKNISAVLLVKERKDLPELALPGLWGDPVNVLWMVGITEKERDYAIEHGSEKLLARLDDHDIGSIHRQRPDTF